jgi:hypothetical protein
MMMMTVVMMVMMTRRLRRRQLPTGISMVYVVIEISLSHCDEI